MFGLITWREIMARWKYRQDDLQSNKYLFLAYFLWLLPACGQSGWKNMKLLGWSGVNIKFERHLSECWEGPTADVFKKLPTSLQTQLIQRWDCLAARLATVGIFQRQDFLNKIYFIKDTNAASYSYSWFLWSYREVQEKPLEEIKTSQAVSVKAKKGDKCPKRKT